MAVSAPREHTYFGLTLSLTKLLRIVDPQEFCALDIANTMCAWDKEEWTHVLHISPLLM